MEDGLDGDLADGARKGDAYELRIRTTFVTPAAAVPGGGVGYDNFELTASRDGVEEGPKGPEGPAGTASPRGGRVIITR